MSRSYLNGARKLRKAMDGAANVLTDEQAVGVIDLYPLWQLGLDYVKDQRIRYEEHLYKCLQNHDSQVNREPDKAVSLWVKVSAEEWPEWVQPAGAHDAYQKGDRVTYQGKRWICYADSTTYAPGVYGWEQA